MQDTSYELLTIFRDGGFMMIPLVLCSLVALHALSRLPLDWTGDYPEGGRQGYIYTVPREGELTWQRST